ncbi:hypothetical protein PVK06_044030 [Gossypium arboreum]|uniref:Uncharacterized protein n=1 Tax=Gossypium arboreum TaxID=29729 RepID=A0ABR0MQ04_GOSAR|nr:hypothetical protein PVK06_044030 [Gossypium arboreum]
MVVDGRNVTTITTQMMTLWWHFRPGGLTTKRVHDYQPPCPNNIIDASKAVWKALGVPKDDWGEMDIDWSDTD